jgi:transcriptional regulator with XRE-family HTH domain
VPSSPTHAGVIAWSRTGEPDPIAPGYIGAHTQGTMLLVIAADRQAPPLEGIDQAMSKSRKSNTPANSPRKDGPQRNDEIVASNMRRFRLARGLSQNELGNALGVTFQQIQKYEKAKNAVAPGRLRQMCEVLGVAPAEMFGSQPQIDGQPIPEMSRWSYRTLIALNKVKSESLRRAIGALIEEMVGSQ